MSTTEADYAAHRTEWPASRPEFDTPYVHAEAPRRVNRLPCRDRTDFLRCVVGSAHLTSVDAS